MGIPDYCTIGKCIGFYHVNLVKQETVFPKHLFPVWFKVRTGQKRKLSRIWKMKWREGEGLETFSVVRCGDGDIAVPGGSQRNWLWSAQHLACCFQCQLCSLTAAKSPPSGAWLQTHRSSCYTKATASPGPPQELPPHSLSLLAMFSHPDVPASSELFLWARRTGRWHLPPSNSIFQTSMSPNPFTAL